MEKLPISDLFARRSVRQFTDEPVTAEQVDLLLKAAMAAPSAANCRPWHFVAVTDPATRTKLAAVQRYTGMVAQAPLCVVPCGEPAASIPDQPDFWIQDLSAAVENLLLAASGLGLGGVWCGIHPNEALKATVREILGVPAEIHPFCLVAIGHPAATPPPRTQYDADRVHSERW